MGSLRDEMLKKGLADKKRERQVRHGEQKRKKEIGADAVEREEEERRRAAATERERQREADRAREVARQREHDEELERDRVPNLIRHGLVASTPFDNRKFYFVTRENTVSFIEVSRGSMSALTAGQMAVVEALGIVPGDFCIITGEAARQLYEVAPDHVRFWNGKGRVSSR